MEDDFDKWVSSIRGEDPFDINIHEFEQEVINSMGVNPGELFQPQDQSAPNVDPQSFVTTVPEVPQMIQVSFEGDPYIPFETKVANATKTRMIENAITMARQESKEYLVKSFEVLPLRDAKKTILELLDWMIEFDGNNFFITSDESPQFIPKSQKSRRRAFIVTGSSDNTLEENTVLATFKGAVAKKGLPKEVVNLISILAEAMFSLEVSGEDISKGAPKRIQKVIHSYLTKIAPLKKDGLVIVEQPFSDRVRIERLKRKPEEDEEDKSNDKEEEELHPSKAVALPPNKPQPPLEVTREAGLGDIILQMIRRDVSSVDKKLLTERFFKAQFFPFVAFGISEEVGKKVPVKMKMSAYKAGQVWRIIAPQKKINPMGLENKLTFEARNLFLIGSVIQMSASAGFTESEVKSFLSDRIFKSEEDNANFERILLDTVKYSRSRMWSEPISDYLIGAYDAGVLDYKKILDLFLSSGVYLFCRLWYKVEGVSDRYSPIFVPMNEMEKRKEIWELVQSKVDKSMIETLGLYAMGVIIHTDIILSKSVRIGIDSRPDMFTLSDDSLEFKYGMKGLAQTFIDVFKYYNA
jgi:hypothetical protein